jgi:APA family basic amino acid/polyamine antiporter
MSVIPAAPLSPPAFWRRLKPIDSLSNLEADRRLAPTLSWPHLLALGIGAVIGTGIYTLIGVGADRAGPAVILAFGIAGLVCAFAALAYTELSTLIPAAGSAYTYAYTILGEGLAWVVGWSLVLEYSVTASAVAVGWSAYAVGALKSLNVNLPHWMLTGPHDGGVVNLPALVIVAAVTALLIKGVKESAGVNIVLVLIKLVALSVFIALTVTVIKAANYHPFMPYGFTSQIVAGHKRGVMAAAALVFFAFFGFDAVSTSAEEVKNPKRDLVIGIMGSMAICTLFYMAVAACAVGAWSYVAFSHDAEPLAFVLRALNHPVFATLIAAAAIVAIPSVIMVNMYGQTRIFFVMARDGLLPRGLSKVDPARGSPWKMTLGVAVFVAVIAGFFRLDEIAELANAGTLLAFISVCAGVLVLRIKQPDLKRVFKCPAVWFVAPAGMLGCAYLFISLPPATLIRFVVWNLIGVGVYLVYGRRKSVLVQVTKDELEGLRN